MDKAIFSPKLNSFQNDYNCILRNPQNEFSVGLHYHDFYEFVIYLGQAGVFRIENSEYLVRRGDIVLIDIFTPHTLLFNKTTQYERFSVDIDLGLLISFSTPTSNLLDIFHKKQDRHPIYHLEEPELQKYLRLLDEYRKIKLNKGQDILEKALIHQILAFVYNDCHTGEHIDELDSHHVTTIAQLLAYINSHLNEEITLAQLAVQVNYSEYYICRLFKKITGKTLVGYIQEKRIQEAAFLMKGNSSVYQVAEQVGFNNYSYFYKTFKKLMGCSPAEYQLASKERSTS